MAGGAHPLIPEEEFGVLGDGGLGGSRAHFGGALDAGEVEGGCHV